MPVDLDRDFKRLFDENYTDLVRFFRRRGLSEELSEDLAQETFLAVLRSSSSFRAESSMRTWIISIATNVWRHHIRDQNSLKRQAHSQLSLEASDFGNSSTIERERAFTIEDSAPLPDEVALKREQNDLLRRAIGELSPQQRQCVELRLYDLKYHEIAAIAGLSIETIKSHLHQARSQLRRALLD